MRGICPAAIRVVSARHRDAFGRSSGAAWFGVAGDARVMLSSTYRLMLPDSREAERYRRWRYESATSPCLSQARRIYSARHLPGGRVLQRGVVD